jgi:sirohydrochlorin cobaltochelatase
LAGGERELVSVAERVRRELRAEVVEVGFLSFAEPGIGPAVERCVRQGVTALVVVPFFLTEGFLARRAIRKVREEAAKYPQLQVSVSAPLGPHPRLVDVVLGRIEEALD